jgi:hypothetical protein
MRYWSGTEKFPPPSGYLAAKPHPTKTGGREDFTETRKRIWNSGTQEWKERYMGKYGFDTNRPRKCPSGFSNHSLHFFS